MPAKVGKGRVLPWTFVKFPILLKLGTHVRMQVCMNVYVYVYVCMCVCNFVSMYGDCVCVCVYVCTYVCMWGWDGSGSSIGLERNRDGGGGCRI